MQERSVDGRGIIFRWELFEHALDALQRGFSVDRASHWELHRRFEDAWYRFAGCCEVLPSERNEKE